MTTWRNSYLETFTKPVTNSSMLGRGASFVPETKETKGQRNAKYERRGRGNGMEEAPKEGVVYGCQMAIARFLDHMCLALRASGLWLRYATLTSGNLGLFEDDDDDVAVVSCKTAGARVIQMTADGTHGRCGGALGKPKKG